jgi:NADH:ubiquinone oxidoreductase subunit 5 (subunit L)/multisubunit Na+/H+ antiporter MnhA subunit
MPDLEILIQSLGLVVIIAPSVLLCWLGIPSLVGRPLPETWVHRVVQTVIWTGLLAALAVLGLMLSSDQTHVMVVGRQWVHIPHYHFAIKLVFDRLSVPLVILTFLLCGTIGAFAARYLHREPGFNRFFVLYSVFLLGMTVASLAGTIETLFAGWELVGLSSAFLVAFYHERRGPVTNGLHVWSVYRVSDAALLIASVVLHHLSGEGDFDRLIRGEGSWPYGSPTLPVSQATLAGLLLVLAAAGKSALIPFSGWLPRAMEGPTPSSAVFYGALSVHLGAFLLLRVSPLLDASPLTCAVIVVLGLTSAAFGALANRVQTDIKSALSFASLTQVGLIFAEIGLGLRYVPLVHILGHACWRTLQFLRAPTVLHDSRQLENAVGGSLAGRRQSWEQWIPERWATWAYRFALERGELDQWLFNWFVNPVREVFLACDRREQSLLRGDESSAAKPAEPWRRVLEESP